MKAKGSLTARYVSLDKSAKRPSVLCGYGLNQVKIKPIILLFAHFQANALIGTNRPLHGVQDRIAGVLTSITSAPDRVGFNAFFKGVTVGRLIIRACLTYPTVFRNAV